MKDIYLVGKQNQGELTLAQFAGELEGRGHTVSTKWWEMGVLPKPYLDNLETSSSAAVQMFEAAYFSDVTIVFPDDHLFDGAVELAASIASARERLDKQTIVVNPFEFRQTIFYAHPAVTAVRGLHQIRQMDWY